MQAKGVGILMEQNGSLKRRTDFRRGHKLGSCDHLIELTKPLKRPGWMSVEEYAEAPAALTIREFKSRGKILVSTLRCAKAHRAKELSSLYKKTLAYRAGYSAHQDNHGDGRAQLQVAGNGGKGDLGLPTGLQLN